MLRQNTEGRRKRCARKEEMLQKINIIVLYPGNNFIIINKNKNNASSNWYC